MNGCSNVHNKKVSYNSDKNVKIGHVRIYNDEIIYVVDDCDGGLLSTYAHMIVAWTTQRKKGRKEVVYLFVTMDLNHSQHIFRKRVRIPTHSTAVPLIT